MHKRTIMQLMRSVVTIVVVGTMAAMIFSLRGELRDAKAKLKAALQVPDTHEILFLQGGASLQFSMIPLNFSRLGDRADYAVTGNFANIAEYSAKTLGVVPAVRAEDGCRMYTLLRDATTDWDKPMRFGERTMWMLEKWDSVDALKAHLETPHMKAFGPTVRHMHTSSTFHVLEAVRR